MNREEAVIIGVIMTGMQMVGLLLPCILIVRRGKKKDRLGLGIVWIVISVLAAALCQLVGFAIAWIGFGVMCSAKNNKKIEEE